jgi:hypothetical protein
MDNELEALIDRAGRQNVFDLVRSQGWTGPGGAPKHVFQNAALMLIKPTEDE